MLLRNLISFKQGKIWLVNYNKSITIFHVNMEGIVAYQPTVHIII